MRALAFARLVSFQAACISSNHGSLSNFKNARAGQVIVAMRCKPFLCAFFNFFIEVLYDYCR